MMSCAGGDVPKPKPKGYASGKVKAKPKPPAKMSYEDVHGALRDSAVMHTEIERDPDTPTEPYSAQSPHYSPKSPNYEPDSPDSDLRSDAIGAAQLQPAQPVSLPPAAVAVAAGAAAPPPFEAKAKGDEKQAKAKQRKPRKTEVDDLLDYDMSWKLSAQFNWRQKHSRDKHRHGFSEGDYH